MEVGGGILKLNTLINSEQAAWVLKADTLGNQAWFSISLCFNFLSVKEEIIMEPSYQGNCKNYMKNA